MLDHPPPTLANVHQCDALGDTRQPSCLQISVMGRRKDARGSLRSQWRACATPSVCIVSMVVSKHKAALVENDNNMIQPAMLCAVANSSWSSPSFKVRYDTWWNEGQHRVQSLATIWSARKHELRVNGIHIPIPWSYWSSVRINLIMKAARNGHEI